MEKVEVTWQVGDIGASTVCAFLSGKPRMKSVALRNCGMVEPHLEVLLDQPTLTDLYLSGNRLTDKFLKAESARFARLRVLALDRNCIGPQGISHLRLGDIEELTIGSHLGGNDIGDMGARYISNMLPAKLRVLRLDNCSIRPAGAQWIVGVLAKSGLVTLGMDANPIGDGGGHLFAKEIPKCNNLRELSLTLCSLTDSSVLALCVACPEWMNVKIVNNPISDLCRKILLENSLVS